MERETVKAYYFSNVEKRLRYGDKRSISDGVTHEVSGPIVLCEAGLHASSHPFDALNYAPGPILWEVELGGEILHGSDKLVAAKRTYLRHFDATALLREFSRECALDVVHLWDAPEVVIHYLKTGDESLRDAASAAAWAARAALDAASAAARDAARAAWAAWAASAAARDAARDAAVSKQRERLSQLIEAEFGRKEEGCG